jgi:hypothetical protein
MVIGFSAVVNQVLISYFCPPLANLKLGARLHQALVMADTAGDVVELGEPILAGLTAERSSQ